jgi:hypothetical protein
MQPNIQGGQCHDTTSFWSNVIWSNYLAESQILTSPHLTWLLAPQWTVTLLVQTFRPIVVTITCWLNDIQLIDLQPNDVVPMLSRY